jgi:drug/metabolite transporter (DMT)-like permease
MTMIRFINSTAVVVLSLLATVTVGIHLDQVVTQLVRKEQHSPSDKTVIAVTQKGSLNHAATLNDQLRLTSAAQAHIKLLSRQSTDAHHPEVELVSHPKTLNATAADTDSNQIMSATALLQTVVAATSLYFAAVVFLYWRQGPLVVAKVVTYLFALTTMKGAVRVIEDKQSFKFPLFITATHFISGVFIAFSLLLREKWAAGQRVEMPPFYFIAAKFTPIAIAIAVSVACGNIALVYSSSSFVEIVGMTTPIATVLVSMSMGQSIQLELLGPLLLVFVGGALTAKGDVHFSTLGLLFSAGAMLPRAIKSILQQVLLQQDNSERSYSPLEVLIWTSIPSSMVMLGWSLFHEGLEPYHQYYAHGFSSILTVALGMSCINACILNLAVLYVIKDLGAVGATVVAQTKSVLVVLGGMTFLNEQVSRTEIFGFMIILGGVYLYNEVDSRTKAKLKAQKAALEKDPAANHEVGK